MSQKYHVKVQPEAPRFSKVSPISTFELDGCLGCMECVKRESCIYDVYRRKVFDGDHVVDTAENICVNCMRCVQECKKGILTRSRNPRYDRLGDQYWTPGIITSLWQQAETGKIPVSGAGYRGSFTGPGFDRMWTDMSEIVRPTRDGIHGREYISTVIELGRRPERLHFAPDGSLAGEPPHFVELPIPLVFDIPRRGRMGLSTRRAIARAAVEAGTLAVATAAEAADNLSDLAGSLIVKLDGPVSADAAAGGAPLVELAYGDQVMDQLAQVKQLWPETITSIRLELDEYAAERVLQLTRAGAEVIHLQADDHGQGYGGRNHVFLSQLLREVHLTMVENSCRDRVTLLVSGGIALAEHVVKAIICGADGVGLDLVLAVAMECRLCGNCDTDIECPVNLEMVPEDWGVTRIMNLLGAFHSQMIEMMGAMGIREVRRLRGEMGRAMVFNDLEAGSFAPLFGKRLEPSQAPTCQPQPMPDPRVYRDIAVDGPKPAPTPSRYRNHLSKFQVIRSTACVACGKCAEVCSYGVHRMRGGKMLKPRAELCRGADHCRSLGSYCADLCPEAALRVGPNPIWDTFGDPRWPAELLVSTWMQSDTGAPPEMDLEYRKGDSGGGFDRIELALPQEPPDTSFTPSDVSLRVPLNRRTNEDRPPVEIGIPIYGGGMSFGSVSQATMISRARAYAALESFTCTGEGGYPDALIPYDDHVITQVATGLFGVREETIQRVRIVEFKYAQGAKPGLGGHLLGDKVTPAVARMREAVEGNALFSPFPFHSVYSVEDHKKHVDWIKQINPRTLVSVKVSTPVDVDMVAVGSYYAGAHIIHLDGSYGGTGAAPDIAKKNIAMPIEYAVPLVHNFLTEEGVRDQVTLIASGGLRSAWDVAKAIALGADAVVTGTADMVALECIRCANCESGRGCPRGIATTDPELSVQYDDDWGAQRLINLFQSWAVQLKYILWRLGLKDIRQLVGRSDLLRHLDYDNSAAQGR